MKTKSKELDVDFIKSRLLTKEEEKRVSEFIQKLKLEKRKSKAKNHP